MNALEESKIAIKLAFPSGHQATVRLDNLHQYIRAVEATLKILGGKVVKVQESSN
jgi:hypothetical protein